MVKINKIYTRTGDKGDTGLVGGGRIAKDADRVGAYGDIDELNAHLGRARTLAAASNVETLSNKLAQIQNELFDLGAELACPPDLTYAGMALVPQAAIKRLEDWIDELMEGIPELRSFVLPGGTELNAELHISRTVCRRVERNVIKLSRTETVRAEVIIYLNRLSDLLFAMARHESWRAKASEYLWTPGKA